MAYIATQAMPKSWKPRRYRRNIWLWVKTLVPLVNPKIAGKWMFIPLKMVSIGIDPYPYRNIIFSYPGKTSSFGSRLLLAAPHRHASLHKARRGT
jgi:hypothetical protein